MCINVSFVQKEEKSADDGMNEFVKGLLTLFVVFEHCGRVENLLANVVDIVGDGIACNLVRTRRAVVYDKLSYHAEMLVQGVSFIGKRFEIEGGFACEDIADLRHFVCKSAGQNKQAHNLDYAYRLLLDVVEVFGGVEDSEGVRFVGAVVAENQIELILAVVVD